MIITLYVKISLLLLYYIYSFFYFYVPVLKQIILFLSFLLFEKLLCIFNRILSEVSISYPVKSSKKLSVFWWFLGAYYGTLKKLYGVLLYIVSFIHFLGLGLGESIFCII